MQTEPLFDAASPTGPALVQHWSSETKSRRAAAKIHALIPELLSIMTCHHVFSTLSFFLSFYLVGSWCMHCPVAKPLEALPERWCRVILNEISWTMGTFWDESLNVRHVVPGMPSHVLQKSFAQNWALAGMLRPWHQQDTCVYAQAWGFPPATSQQSRWLHFQSEPSGTSLSATHARLNYKYNE